MRYDAVIFDLFGTLVPYVGDKEFLESLPRTAEILGCSVDALESEWCGEAAFIEAVTSRDHFRNRMEQTCHNIGIAPDSERVSAAVESRLDAHRQWLRPRPSSVSTLAALRGRGLRLGLMSVCSGEVPLLWAETPFDGCFDAVGFSCEEGLMKDPPFFALTCERLGVKPERTMYVGDDATEELAAAAKVGMTPVLMRTHKVFAWPGLAVDEPEEVLALIDAVG